MSPKVCVLLGFSWMAATAACTSTDADDDGTSPECGALDPAAAELDCGTYEEDLNAPCEGGGGEPGGTDGATDGGGSDDGGSSGDACAELAASNDAVVACVLQADADGEAFSFEHATRNISIFERSRYHVASDGAMWRSNDDALDLCFYTATRVYGSVSFASCDAWDCVLDQVGSAPLLSTCEESNTCGL